MTLHADVLKHVISSTGTPEEAVELIQKYESIHRQVVERKQRIDVIWKRAKKETDKLMEEQLCSHEIRKTHGDPSGNGDNEEECLICREWLKKKEVRFT